MPRTLFAQIAMPMPVPQTSTPRSCRPAAIASATAKATSGYAAGLVSCTPKSCTSCPASARWRRSTSLSSNAASSQPIATRIAMPPPVARRRSLHSRSSCSLIVAGYICKSRNTFVTALRLDGRRATGGSVMRYVIGVDGGTESLRAHVFDCEGRDRGGAKSAYATSFPAPGRAEQAPRDWWAALAQAVRGAVHAAGVDARDIDALALDTTSATVVLADAAGEALRPALLWMDVRAADEAEAVLATGA